MKAGTLRLKEGTWFGRYQIGGQPFVEVKLGVSDQKIAEQKLTEFRRHALLAHRAKLQRELGEVETEITGGGWLGGPLEHDVERGPLTLKRVGDSCRVLLLLGDRLNFDYRDIEVTYVVVVDGGVNNVDRLTREWIASLAGLVR